MKVTKQQLYQRQITLPEFGKEGQNLLQKSNVMVIGCGGLGNIVAVYLAASGIGKIHLIDFDVVDVSNLHRQVFYKTEDIGRPKAEVLSNHLKAISPFVEVTVSNKAISKKNIFTQIEKADIVLDCTDSLAIKYLINDACILKNKILIYGSLYKFDGYVASFNVPDEKGNTGCNLRDAFPEIPKNYIPNCSEAGTLNSIVGIIGLMQANEVIKIVSKIGVPLRNQLLIYNSLDNSQFKMKLKNSFTKDQIQLIFENENYEGPNCELQDPKLLISAEELRTLINSKENKLKIISVIEDINTLIPFDVDLKIPLSKFEVEKISFKNELDYVIICHQGISSYIATQKIKSLLPNLNVLNLKDGINQY